MELAAASEWSFFASVFSMDLATGNSFSAGYLGQPAAMFGGDLTADECPGEFSRGQAPPTELDGSHQTVPVQYLFGYSINPSAAGKRIHEFFIFSLAMRT
jgi:hypothetical protein